MNEARVRDEIARACARMAARAWVANHDGNVSARVAPNRFLCTPTATAKEVVQADGLVVTDASGKQTGGRGKAFSE